MDELNNAGGMALATVYESTSATWQTRLYNQID
jgi:hypothetical protein